MRPTRKKLKFDEESVNELLQEIYNDSHNIRAKITRLFTKWEQKVKEGGEIQAIGDQIIKLIAAEAKTQDQKIMLLRYLKEVVFEKKSGDTDDKRKDDETGTLSSDRKNELLSFVQNEIEKKEKEKRGE
jgi:membrane-bound lytic murein transglycosylase